MNVLPDGVSSSQGGGLYSLKWNQFESCMSLGLAELLEDEEYSMTDVTLACEGEFIQAHKIALAMSSPFFKQFFKLNRVDKAGITLIALANMKFKDLKNIIRFIYHGQVQLSNADLTDFLAAADLLKIRGLEQSSSNIQNNDKSEFKSVPPSSSRLSAVHPPPPVSSDFKSASVKRRRLSGLSPSTNPTPPQTSFQLPSTAPAPILSSLLEDYSSGQNFNEDDGNEEEAMISYEDVKMENIAVYSANEHQDADDENYNDLTGDSGDNTNETACDEVEFGYPNPSFPILQYDSTSGGSTEPPDFALGPGTSTQRTPHKKAGRPPIHGSTPSLHRGSCKFCPARKKTVSPTKCYNCVQFLCAKDTCRVKVQLKYDGSIVSVCRNCVSLIDGTPLPLVR